jgi:hypothetical protein
MGIFSRLFQRGQEGQSPAGDADKSSLHDDDGDSSAKSASEDAGAAAAPVLAAAVAGGAGSLTAPLWGWPQRYSEPARDGAAAPLAPGDPPAQQPQEASVNPPGEDPPVPPRRSLPSLPKITAPPSMNGSGNGSGNGASGNDAATSERPQRAVTTPPSNKRRDDSTMIMSPPPAPVATGTAVAPKPSAPPPAAATAGVAAAPAAKPAPAAPLVAAPPPPTTAALGEEYPPTNPEMQIPVMPVIGDEISESFNRVFFEGLEVEPKAEVATAGVSTAEDLAAVRDVFNDIAVVHVSQVRDVMLELRFGDADPAWLESTKPALRSLRAMAEQMELLDLCSALDSFCVSVDAAVANRARINEDAKAELLEKYQRLSEQIPQAFELDAERDRREPIIVEALLYQIDGVEKPVIDRLFAVGLNRLDALMSANLEDVVAVSGVRQEVAQAIVEQFRTYRATADAAVSTRDPSAERRSLGDLVIMLSILQDDFLRAADDWSDDARTRKRALRKEREQTFQRIRVSLVRLGDRDQLAKLERLPFNERIAALERYVANQPPGRA